MDFLKNYVCIDTYEYILSNSSEKLLSSIKENEDVIKTNYEYFKSIGLDYFEDIFKYRIDLMLLNKVFLIRKISSLDKAFIVYTIKNDIGNLINMGI